MFSKKQKNNQTTNKEYDLLKMMELNVKQAFKPSAVIMQYILFPIIIALAFSIFLPIWFSFTFIIYISLLVVISSLFITLYYSYAKTTFSDNISLTRYNSIKLYFSIWIIMVLISVMITFVIILTLFILTLPSIDIAMTDFSFQNSSEKPVINWLDIWWATLFYYDIVFTTVMFFVFVTLMNFIVSKKSFYIFVLSFLLLTLFTGGTMSVTWTFIDGEATLIEPGNAEDPFGALDPFLVGTPMWWFSQLMPTYHINQFIFNSVLAGVEVLDETDTRLIDAVNNVNSGSPFRVVGSNLEWKYYFAMPYINILFYWALNNFLKEFLNK